MVVYVEGRKSGECMKTHWWMAICLTVLFAVTSNVAPAQDRAQDRQDRQDRNDGVNRVRNNANRNRHSHATFNDHDRKIARDWYYQSHEVALIGLRYQDRLSADEESRLQVGSPLDADLRQKVYPVPLGLWHRLGRAPRNYHYVAIGGHVVEIDDMYQDINDFIHLEFNF
jgi:Ni/Co efflux regulator RcnB